MITASRLFFGQSAVSGLWQCLPKLEFDLIQKSSAMWPKYFFTDAVVHDKLTNAFNIQSLYWDSPLAC